MKITFLGTGTSHGIPVIGCDCIVCTSNNIKDNRLRSSIMVEAKGKTIVVDTGPDFRQQMLRENVKRLDAVIFTHEHKDHTAGLDDTRSFNFWQDEALPVYATERVQKNLMKSFDYIFSGTKYPGIPQVDFHTIALEPFVVEDIEVTPIEVLHYRLPVLGFRFGNFTYITDANFISDEEKEKIYGTEVLVLNALRIDKHISHFSLEEAIAMVKELNPGVTYFTHISHQLGLHDEVENQLPENIHLAYDGLKLDLEVK